MHLFHIGLDVLWDVVKGKDVCFALLCGGMNICFNKSSHLILLEEYTTTFQPNQSWLKKMMGEYYPELIFAREHSMVHLSLRGKRWGGWWNWPKIPTGNFSYFHAFQDPLWLDGMQDRFYLTLIQAVPHSERKAYILVWGCGLNLFFRVFFKPCSTSYLAVRGWGTCCWLQD